MTESFDPFGTGPFSEAEAAAWMLESAASMAADAIRALRSLESAERMHDLRGVPRDDPERARLRTVMEKVEELPDLLRQAIQP